MARIIVEEMFPNDWSGNVQVSGLKVVTNRLLQEIENSVGITSVVAGENIVVSTGDPANPVISAPAVVSSDVGNMAVLSGGDGLIYVPDFSLVNLGTGLERVQEGQNAGWRLVGQDPANFGIIGKDAINFAGGEVPSTTNGATGINSMAGGGWNQNSGVVHGTTASGSNAIAWGSGDYASGPVASGINSQAFGFSTHAEGINSTAIGDNTAASNPNMLAAGRYNVNTDINTVFEFGVGLDYASKANAFEIYTDGRIHAPEQTIALHDVPQSLTTKEYVDTQSNTKLDLSGGTITGPILMTGLPITDPGIPGALWDNVGVLSISQ